MEDLALLRKKQNGSEWYERKDSKGNLRKFEIAKVDNYSFVILNDIHDRSAWKIDEHIIPEKHITPIVHHILIPVFKDNKRIAIAVAEGFSSGYDYEKNKVKNGEAVVVQIIHEDGLVNTLPNERRFNIEIENGKRTIGEGKSKTSEKFLKLRSDNEVDDAKKLLKEVMISKSGLMYVPSLQTNMETSHKLEVANASHEGSISPTAIAGLPGKYSFIA